MIENFKTKDNLSEQDSNSQTQNYQPDFSSWNAVQSSRNFASASQLSDLLGNNFKLVDGKQEISPEGKLDGRRPPGDNKNAEYHTALKVGSDGGKPGNDTKPPAGDSKLLRSGNVSPEFKKQVEQKIDSLPKGVKDTLEKNGYVIVAAKNTKEVMGDAADKQVPGWPKGQTWNHVPLVTQTKGGKKEIIVAETYLQDGKTVKNSSVDWLLGKTIGGALDKTLGIDGKAISSTAEFKAAYDRDIAKLSDTDKKTFSEFLSSNATKATAAEMFRLKIGQAESTKETKFMKAFPEVGKLIDQKLAADSGSPSKDLDKAHRPDGSEKPRKSAADVSKILETKDVSPEFKRELEKALSSMPKKVIDLFEKNGVKVVAGKTMTDLWGPRANERPRGYGKDYTWNSLGGATEYSYSEEGNKATIYISEYKTKDGKQVKTDDIAFTALHESGHALDFILRKDAKTLSAGPEIKAAFERDVSNIAPKNKEALAYFLQPGEAGRSETVADMFRILMQQREPSRNDELKKKSFPEVSKVLLPLIR